MLLGRQSAGFCFNSSRPDPRVYLCCRFKGAIGCPARRPAPAILRRDRLQGADDPRLRGDRAHTCRRPSPRAGCRTRVAAPGRSGDERSRCPDARRGTLSAPPDRPADRTAAADRSLPPTGRPRHAPRASELDQAQLRPTGPIAHELGIERDEGLSGQRGAQLGEFGGGGQQGHAGALAVPVCPSIGAPGSGATGEPLAARDLGPRRYAKEGCLDANRARVRPQSLPPHLSRCFTSHECPCYRRGSAISGELKADTRDHA